MIGILLVSHSKRLAEGLAELIQALAGNTLTVGTVGGQETLGVDATMVVSEFEQLKAQGCEAILVFGDLGSAFIAAETARDLFVDAGDIRVADAPFVEGSVAAAMVLATGGRIDDAIASAQEAYQIHKC